MLPAHERFHAGRVRRSRRIDFGLVVQDELVARDAVTQLAQQREPVRRLILLLGDEDPQAVPGLLGLAKRDVRTPQ